MTGIVVEPVGPVGPSAGTAPGVDGPSRPPGPLLVVAGGVLRVLGGVVAVALAGVTAVVEIFFTPLRVGGVLICVSVVLAAVVNFFLPRFTVAVTGIGWVALLPPLAWFALTMVAAGKRAEGDVLITGWVGLLTIFVGSIAFAAGGYRLLLPPPRDRVRSGPL